jgi:hypothetical protein
MAAILEYVRLSEVALDLAPKCVVCTHRTTMACSQCQEPICPVCADEQNMFDGEDIICLGCADTFTEAYYRDTHVEWDHV